MSHFNNVNDYRSYITYLLNNSTDDKTTLQAILDDINNTEITDEYLNVINNITTEVETSLPNLRTSKSYSYRIYYKTQAILYKIIDNLNNKRAANSNLNVDDISNNIDRFLSDISKQPADIYGGRRKKAGSKKKGSKTGSKKKKSKRLSKRRSKKKGSKK